MSDQMAIRSAETMAFMRAVVSGEKNLAVKSEDRLARHFLGGKYRLLVNLSQSHVAEDVGLHGAWELRVHYR